MARRDVRVGVPEESFGVVDIPSFEDFYVGEYRAVLVLARVLVGDPARAEDITHDAFTSALANWSDIDKPAAWVRTALVNSARSGWRRRNAEERAYRRLGAIPNTTDSFPVETETFWDAVRQLPRRQAQAIALFYLEDLPVSEIAQILECQESTARVHLMRGRRALSKSLELHHE